MKELIWLTGYNPSSRESRVGAQGKDYEACRADSHPSTFLREFRSTCLGVFQVTVAGSSYAYHQPRKCPTDTLKGHLMVSVLQLKVPSSRCINLATEHTRPQSYVSYHSGQSPRLRMPHDVADSSSVTCFFCNAISSFLSSFFPLLHLSVLILTQLYPNRQPGVFVSIRSNQDSHKP